MDQTTRKIMTLHKHYDVDRLYVQENRKEGDVPVSKSVLTHPYNDSKTT